MPAFDGTGPAGTGPTGWGRGGCRGLNFARRSGTGGRRGFCGFFGRKRLKAADERTLLTEQAEAVSGYLKELQARLKELDKA